ncbi:pregnancy-associated plasma protein-A [Natranaerovirga hydrolytica]|uniref:Pregnancy-associated plasma protein-A n=1 Tax=Natranaerovirga hydrolytica TaxID=680378 RepID=A0A4R1MMT0_9FIRM|nr:M43 family zinc metalloprotease [Natranaerovirga hydrolytica]TCK93202.1 pregnancy-associated plasma protein-A [Natranaerovirga hydrolytica]
MYKNYDGGTDYSQRSYAKVSAHEFGHVLGIGDAYPSKEDNRPGAGHGFDETPHNMLMRNNSVLTSNEVEMVWEAWKTNEWQYFQTYKNYIKTEVIRSY